MTETEQIAALTATLQIARGALADIAFSDDMTLAIAKAKAKRIYEATAPDDERE